MKERLGRYAEDAEISVLPALKIPVRARFLVASRHCGDFEATYLDLLRDRTELRFSLVGPWPPYSFVMAGVDVSPGMHGANKDEEHV
jgi:hypothetical protein